MTSNNHIPAILGNIHGEQSTTTGSHSTKRTDSIAYDRLNISRHPPGNWPSAGKDSVAKPAVGTGWT